MIKGYVVVFLAFVSLGFSQSKSLTVIDVFKKSQEFFNKQDYSFYKTKYTVYIDYTSDVIFEQYNGILLKKNKINYVKIKDTEFISFEDYSVKINNDEKAVQVLKFRTSDFQSNPLELNSYLSDFETKTIRSDKDYYICELKPKKLSQTMLSKVVVYVKKNDFSISKQVLYYVENIEVKDKNGKKSLSVPRLEITFAVGTKDVKRDNLLVNQADYFTVKSSDIKLSKRLSSYKLFKS